MRTVGLVLEYDGTGFQGWQRLPGKRTVQSVVQEALAAVLGEELSLVGASRTDAGVHATGQVAHFLTNSPIPAEKMPFVLNPVLPPDVRIRGAFEAQAGFNARFSSVGKRYRYSIYAAPQASALWRHRAMHVFLPIDRSRMRAAAEFLVGQHDFSAFRDAGCQSKTTIRTIHQVEVVCRDPFLELVVAGNAFLYHMVRILAGTLVAAGTGKLEAADIPDILARGDRRLAGPTAPACGLVLEEVLYDSAGMIQLGKGRMC